MADALGRGATWDSALSVSGFAAIRSVGFEPAGQVFGAAVFNLSATAGVSCPGVASRSLPQEASPGGVGRGRTAVAGGGIPGPAARIARALYEGRRTAIDRMADECADVGGHGIVGAALQISEIPAGQFTAGAVEFTVIGTAVRARTCPPLARPFATDLCGQDFAKLVMGGWMPAGIALGISVAALHDDLVTTSSGPWGSGNAEVPAYTDLMVQVRQDARSRLEKAIRRLGADGVVVSAMTLHVRSEACQAHAGGTDHFAEAVTTGTAVARFASPRTTPQPPSLAILPLGTDRAGRSAGRWRLSTEDAEAALAGRGSETLIEGCYGRTALLLGGKKHAAVRHLEARSGAKYGQADWRVLAEGDRAHVELGQRGRGAVKTAGAGRADEDLSQGDRASPERLLSRGTK
jgi:uncharacterized protein YbjQ (UPF0145 family)